MTRLLATQPLLPMRALAALLGVTSNQVYMWHQRRHTTGFPSMVAQTLTPQFPGDKRRSPLFDVEAVMDWYAEWDANRNRGSYQRKGMPVNRS